MSIFGDILSKVFHAAAPAASPQQAASAKQPQTQTASAAPQPGSQKPAQASPTGQPAPQHVDVEKVLSDLAAKKGGGGNWRTSIVDLLKLLDLDSSLSARKQLGQELNVHAGADGSAEQNIALQKAVWAKLAENGGHVPASLRS